MWNDCSLSVREHKIKGTGKSLPIKKTVVLLQDWNCRERKLNHWLFRNRIFFLKARKET
jgi:hypothetical protein